MLEYFTDGNHLKKNPNKAMKTVKSPFNLGIYNSDSHSNMKHYQENRLIVLANISKCFSTLLIVYYSFSFVDELNSFSFVNNIYRILTIESLRKKEIKATFFKFRTSHKDL